MQSTVPKQEECALLRVEPKTPSQVIDFFADSIDLDEWMPEAQPVETEVDPEIRDGVRASLVQVKKEKEIAAAEKGQLRYGKKISLGKEVAMPILPPRKKRARAPEASTSKAKRVCKPEPGLEQEDSESFKIPQSVLEHVFPKSKVQKMDAFAKQFLESHPTLAVNFEDYCPQIMEDTKLVLDLAAFANANSTRSALSKTALPSETQKLICTTTCGLIANNKKKTLWESHLTRSPLLMGGSCDICLVPFWKSRPGPQFAAHVMRVAVGAYGKPVPFKDVLTSYFPATGFDSLKDRRTTVKGTLCLVCPDCFVSWFMECSQGCKTTGHAMESVSLCHERYKV